jgi:hypothetical protein
MLAIGASIAGYYCYVIVVIVGAIGKNLEWIIVTCLSLMD